jgi:hypothetical protein
MQNFDDGDYIGNGCTEDWKGDERMSVRFVKKYYGRQNVLA